MRLERSTFQCDAAPPVVVGCSGGADSTALLALAGVTDAEVEVAWNPPWHPSMMSDVGREMTGVR